MSDSNEEVLSSIRRHARAQTALQAGALAELEAQRQQLAAQSTIMAAAERRADLVEFDQNELSQWRQALADAVVLAETGNALQIITGLSEKRELIEDIPKLAKLDEITEAKKLLQKMPAYLDSALAENPALVARLENWWNEHQLEERREKVDQLMRPYLEARSVEREEGKGASSLHGLWLTARRDLLLMKEEVAGIEALLAKLNQRDELPLLSIIHPEAASDFLTRDGADYCLREVEKKIQAVDDAKTAAERVQNAQDNQNMVGVVIAILFILFIVVCAVVGGR